MSEKSSQRSKHVPKPVLGVLVAWIVLNVIVMGTGGDRVVDGFLAFMALPESMAFTVYLFLTVLPLLVSGIIVRIWGEFDAE